MFKVFAATALAAALLAGSARAQELVFKDWDTNGDGQIDQNEFNAGIQKQGAFARWDTDHDKQLSEQEFERGMFKDYDVNGDNAILQDEAGTGLGLGIGAGLGGD